MKPGLYVVVYDVVDDRRRDRLFHLLKEYGTPFQKSAFEARLTEHDRRSMLARAARVVDLSTDRFACYPVARVEEPRITCLGLPRPEVGPGEVEIV